MSAPTPNTFVIGAGPVATALAGAMRLGGVPVLGLWARKPEAARAAGAIAGVAAYSSAPPDALLEVSAVIVAVRDAHIADVARTIVGTGFISKSHVLIHCSGAMSADEAFAGVRDHIGGCAVMHPLRAFRDPRAAMRALQGTVFGTQGDGLGLDRARALIAAMGGVELALDDSQIGAYHAAAAVVSNYLVALVDVATELLGSVGIDRDRAVDALVPLAAGSVENLRDRGLPDALTGPIRRGDQDTVARHLGALRGHPELDELYRVLGRRVVTMARHIGDAAPTQLEAISRLLAPAKTS